MFVRKLGMHLKTGPSLSNWSDRSRKELEQLSYKNAYSMENHTHMFELQDSMSTCRARICQCKVRYHIEGVANQDWLA